MEKLGLGLDDDSTMRDQKQTNPQESKRVSIQRSIQSLVHASKCSDANCQLLTCRRLKRVVQHAKSCKRKANAGCPICKQLIALCYHHARYCQVANCPVPFCLNLKYKQREQQMKRRLQQAEILKRRIAAMQKRRTTGTQTSPGNSNSSSQPSRGAQPHTSPHLPQPGVGMKPATGPSMDALQAVQAVALGLLQAVQAQMQAAATKLQPSPGAQPHTSAHLPQPGVGMKPATGPSIDALQAVQAVALGLLQAVQAQMQAAATRQTAPHMVAASVNYGKGNPVVSPPTANPAFMSTQQQMHAQMQKPMSQMMLGVPNRMLNVGSVSCWEGPNYGQNPQPHQSPQPQPLQPMGLRQASQLIRPGNMPNSIGNTAMGPPQVMQNPGPSSDMQVPRQALQQLIQVLKSPYYPQQLQQVLDILKSNPPIMDAFIKLRTAQQAQQKQE